MLSKLIIIGSLFVASTTLGQEHGFTNQSDNESKLYHGALLEERPYSGDYSTAMIKSMWNACWQANMRTSGNTPAPMIATFCDCIVDLVRNGHSVKEHEITGNRFLQNKIATDYAPQCSKMTIEIMRPQPKNTL